MRYGASFGQADIVIPLSCTSVGASARANSYPRLLPPSIKELEAWALSLSDVMMNFCGALMNIAARSLIFRRAPRHSGDLR